MLVAGKKLAMQSLSALEAGECRIRRDLGMLRHKEWDLNRGVLAEHKQSFADRAAAIMYVANTCKPSMEILEKYKCKSDYGSAA